MLLAVKTESYYSLAIFKRRLVVVFIAAISILVFLSMFYKFFILNNIYSCNNYKLSDKIDILILGASHSACAFDPQIIRNS